MPTQFRVMKLSTILAFCITCSLGQSSPTTPSPSPLVPESGYLCSDKYTNAFFGFSLSLPKHANLKVFSDSLKGPALSHFLISFASDDGKNTFVIAARTVGADAKHDAQDEAAGSQELRTKKIQLGGSTFWEGETKKRNHDGGAQALTFATERKGYVLAFYIVSLGPAFTNELEQSVQSLTFFEPTQVPNQPEPGCKVYNPSLAASSSRISRLSDGVVADNAYYNSDLGFHYQIPDGWTIYDQPTQGRDPDASHQFLWRSPFADREHAVGGECTKDLLLATQYAEGARLNRFNPVALLIAVDPVCAPHVAFPDSVNDHQAIQRIAGVVSDYFRTPAMNPMGPARVRAFNNAGRVMLEISQPLTLSIKTSADASTYDLHTSLLVMKAEDYWIIWMFATDNDKQLDELRSTRIFFNDIPGGSSTP